MVLTTTVTVSSSNLDEPDVRAEALVYFHQERLHSESLVLMMTMSASMGDLDVKAEALVIIFHQKKKLHSGLKYFDVRIRLQVQLPNLGIDYGFGTYCG